MNKLINNDSYDMHSILKSSIPKCREFYFIVSFIRFSGVQMLLDTLKKAQDLGISGKIITTNYMNVTEKRALESLLKFENIQLRFFDGEIQGFHPKGYIFDFKDSEQGEIIIGSSNISRGGLRSNIEWSSSQKVEKNSPYWREVLDDFHSIWEKSQEYDPEKFIESEKILSNNTKENFEKKSITPNYMQKIGLANLERLRENGGVRALGVATTGTGKTYLAAFDIRNFNPKKALFIVHREEILIDAEKNFKRVSPHKKMGRYSGSKKELDCDYLFATVQSLHRNLENFDSEEFQYIVIDEAHHIAGETYKKILDYFSPKFILGLTATPERADGYSIFQEFHGNIVMEIRIREALEEKLIAPFHYYGVTDIKEVDLSDVDIRDVDRVSKKLMVHKRSLFIKEKLEFYGYSGDKMRVLGFCASVEHAKFMAEEFRRLGIDSVSLTGENSVEERKKQVELLSDIKSPLKVIFTVDIFNEGIDIPSVNCVLMLRPTDSPTVFIQQLGRGLRKSSDKDFLTVIDFIGNHNKVFLTALSLTGNSTYDKDSLRTALNNDFKNFFRDLYISIDEISKDKILAQIENENFNTMKYLKEEYLTFKNSIGKIPSYIDYSLYESAPNIGKFTLKSYCYFNFLNSVEKISREKNSDSYSSMGSFLYNFNANEEKILRDIEGMLPIKRIHEYAILKEFLDKELSYSAFSSLEYLSLINGSKIISKYIENNDEKTTLHSFQYLSGKYFDGSELRQKIPLFNLSKEILENKTTNLLTLTKEFETALNNISFRKYLDEVLIYGIMEYEKRFGSKNYGVPFLKLYQEYSMKDTALLSNYGKLHSSYRNGVNPSEDRKNYYLFITLNKDRGAIFDNEIFDRRRFKWFSKSSTALESSQGQDIVNSCERGVSLHFFIRKFNRIDGITQPFLYMGKGVVDSYTGEKPIVCTIRLDERIDEKIYLDLISQ